MRRNGRATHLIRIAANKTIWQTDLFHLGNWKKLELVKCFASTNFLRNKINTDKAGVWTGLVP